MVQEGFKASNMRSWRLHWDHQLYKALEHQYQLGLEALNEHLPEIRVEMIFRSAHPLSLSYTTAGCGCVCVCRHQKLQFRPSLEEIRAKYYRELRK